MSMLLMVKAMQTKVGNPLRKLVLIKLADNANDMGECWPSYQHIADQCEMSKTSVRNHIKKLGESGLLKVEHREGPKGNSSNLYHLTLHPIARDGTGIAVDGIPLVAGDDTRTSHSIEPVIEPVIEPKRSLSAGADAISVLTYLNEICGTKYKPTTKSHIENINARLADHSVEDCRLVIDKKFNEWGHDDRMAGYLRPQTLFSAGKFDGYLMAAKTAPKTNKHDLSNITYTSGKF